MSPVDSLCAQGFAHPQPGAFSLREDLPGWGPSRLQAGWSLLQTCVGSCSCPATVATFRAPVQGGWDHHLLLSILKPTLLSAPFWAGLARDQSLACLPEDMTRSFLSSAAQITECPQIQQPPTWNTNAQRYMRVLQPHCKRSHCWCDQNPDYWFLAAGLPPTLGHPPRSPSWRNLPALGMGGWGGLPSRGLGHLGFKKLRVLGLPWQSSGWLYAFSTGCMGSNPGWGTKIPHTAWQKKKVYSSVFWGAVLIFS